jgi:hypothetical protein
VAVQPETSSSYLGSVTRISLACQQRWTGDGTTQNGPVNGQEAVLETLLQVSLLEGLLLGDDAVQVLARVYGYLVAAVSVVDTKVREPLVGICRLAAVGSRLQVEQAGVGVLHADPPALHRRRAEDKGVAFAAFGFLHVSARTRRYVCARSGICRRPLLGTRVRRSKVRGRGAA